MPGNKYYRTMPAFLFFNGQSGEKKKKTTQQGVEYYFPSTLIVAAKINTVKTNMTVTKKVCFPTIYVINGINPSC